MNTVKIAAAVVATAIATLVVPAALQAEPPMIVEGVRDLPTAYVSYLDLNLAEPSDVGQLHARVRRAAARLCFDNGRQPLLRVMQGYQCRNEAIDGAQSQIEVAIANAGNARYAAAARIAVSLR